MFFETPDWDLSLLHLINLGRHPVLDAVMPFFSSLLLAWVLGLALFLWTLWRRNGIVLVQGIFLALMLTVTDQGCNFIKDGTSRTRPLNAQGGIYVYSSDSGQWRKTPPGFSRLKKDGKSYPSSHAANSMAGSILIMLFLPRMRPWLILLPMLVGYSRIYLGHHYPADVLAGWVVGASAGVVFVLLWPYAVSFLSRRSLWMKTRLRM